MSPRFPERTANQDLEEQSRRAFMAIIPPDLFVYRGPETDDYGRDVELELRGPHTMLNIRVHVQLKSKEDAKPLRDGQGFSFSAERKTVEYLSNNLPGAIWVLYVASKTQLLWEWNHKVQDNFRSKPLKQRTVAHHFRNLLDNAAFQDIYNKALVLHTQLMLALDAMRMATMRPRLTVDAKVDGTTVLGAMSLVKSYGVSLANGGEFESVTRWSNVIPQIEYSRDPELAAIRAYVLFRRGDYASSWVALRDVDMVKLSSTELQAMVSFLNATLGYVQGHVNITAYQENLYAIELNYPESSIALSIRLDRLRIMFMKSHWSFEDPEVAIRYKQGIEVAVEDARKLEAIGLVAYGELLLSNVELQMAIRELAHAIISRRFSTRPPSHEDDVETAKMLSERLQRWFANVQRFFDDDKLSQLLRLQARMQAIGGFLQYTVNLIAAAGNPLELQDRLALQQLLPLATDVAAGFSKLGDVGHELEADLLTAEILMAVGAGERASELGRSVQASAGRFGMTPIYERATRFLEGHTMVGLIDFVRQSRPLDEMVDSVPEGRAVLVRRLCEDFGYTRVEAEKEVGWLVDDAREQKQHCQFLVSVLDSESTKPSARRYQCEHYHHQSSVASTDRTSLLRLFKAKFCLGCHARSPRT